MTIINPQAWGGRDPVKSQYGAEKGNVWIPYKRGEDIVRGLQTLLGSPPSHRPECRLIYGESNVGKTSIAIELASRVNGPQPNPDGDRTLPVLCVEAPTNASVKLFCEYLLRPFNFPSIPRTLDGRLIMVLNSLPGLGVKMIVVDEIHNIINAKYNQKMEFLTSLKHLTNQLRIPFVLIGTDAARALIQSDQQLGNRFVPFYIPGWTADKEFGLFVNQVFSYWGLDATPLTGSKKKLNDLFYRTSGLTGETVSLARALAREIETQRGVVLTKDREGSKDNKLLQINSEDLEQLIAAIRWTRPEERRLV